MNSTRIQQLYEFLKETPDDPFLLYALALEYSEERPDKAREIFEELLSNHPDYLPTYYHAAALMEQTGHREHAILIYEKGIKLARLQSATTALRELQNAYNQLLFEEE